MRAASTFVSVFREQDGAMFSTRKGTALIRPATCALVWTCLLAGCADAPDRPTLDLLLLRPNPPAPSKTAGTAGNDPGAVSQPAGILAKETPPALIGTGPLVSASSDHVPPPLTLPEAIAFALRNNPRLLSALAATERAGGQETAAFAPFLPQVDLLSRYVATGKTTVPGSPGPTGVVNVLEPGPYQLWQSELQIQWILYDFGRTAGRYGQASMREKITRLQLVRAEETVAWDVAAAYLKALEAAAYRRIAVETVRRAEAVLEDVRARKEGGVALRDDVLRDEVHLSEARDELVRDEDAEIDALAQLNNAMGRDASLPLRLDEGVYPGKFTASLADCLQQAAAQRPEVGVARDRVAVAEYGREAARGEFLPELDLKGSLGRIGGEEVITGWQEGVGIQLNIPLYRGGAPRGDLRAAQAEISQASADAQGVLNDISLEVTVAHRGVRSAQERVVLARPAVEQSSEALRIVRERYRNGTATPTDVISAETASTRAEQRYASARLEYRSALARLVYVLGDDPRGFCGPPPGPELQDEPSTPLPMPRRVAEKPSAEQGPRLDP